MSRIATAALALVLLLGVVPASAESARQIAWEDLVPPGTPLSNPLAHLSNDNQEELAILYGIREAYARGQITEVDDRYEDGVELTYKLEHDDGLDVDGLLAQFAAFYTEVKRRNEAVDKGLDGQLVRLPGYALPLEYSETAVNELLLVPYVGACIHVPPPPVNQTVFVHLDKPWEPDSLYEPVWITGRMTAKPSSKSLYYVDGESSIDTGYTLEGIEIEPYTR